MRLLFGRLVRAEGRQPRRLMGLPFNWPARFVADSPYSQGGRDRFAILAVSAIRSDDRFPIPLSPSSPPSEPPAETIRTETTRVSLGPRPLRLARVGDPVPWGCSSGRSKHESERPAGPPGRSNLQRLRSGKQDL
jgi:hypothetical protein